MDTRRITDTLKVPMIKQMVADNANIPLVQADTDEFFAQLGSDKNGASRRPSPTQTAFNDQAAQMHVVPLNFTSLPALSEKYHPTVKENHNGVEATVVNDQALTPDGEAFVAANVARIREVVGDRQAKQELADIESAVAQSGGGFDNRTVWLIVVSFLVCVVGIANAMLMSVTERFREIATMKCLGATDGFIMINFILESVMQGLAGGVIGSILGFVLGTLRAWATYGNMAWQHFPLLHVSGMAGIALVVGVVVSALAAVYPAYVAARLAPMEAMRIE